MKIFLTILALNIYSFCFSQDSWTQTNPYEYQVSDIYKKMFFQEFDKNYSLYIYGDRFCIYDSNGSLIDFIEIKQIT